MDANVREVPIASNTNPMKAAASIIHLLDEGKDVVVTAVGRAERVAHRAIQRVRVVLERQGRTVNIGYSKTDVPQREDRLPRDEYLRQRALRRHPESFTVVKYYVTEYRNS